MNSIYKVNDRHKISRCAVVIIPFCLWLILSAQYIINRDRLSYDSLVYIDCARSIEQGQGFQTRVGTGLELPDWEKLSVFPPGYPILIAIGISLGLHPYTSAIAVSMISMGLFLFLCLSYFSVRLPFRAALTLGIILSSMGALLNAGTMCWSEGTYMLLTAVSLLCLIKGNKNKMGKKWLFAAGISGGMSWCVRNVAVSLFVASMCFLLFQFARTRTKTTISGTVIWLAGWVIGAGWLVIWNYVTFGKLIPYTMPSSELSFVWNCAVAVWTMSKDLLALGSFSRFSLVTLLIVICFVVLLLRNRKWSWRNAGAFLKNSRDYHPLLFFLGFYCLTIVVARSVYKWGEPVNSRHFVPIYWILLLLFGWCAERLIAQSVHGKKKIILIIYSGLACLGMLHIRLALLSGGAVDHSRESRLLAEILGSEISKEQVILTDVIAPFRVFGDVNARHITSVDGGHSISPDDISQAGESGHLWGIVIKNDNYFQIDKNNIKGISDILIDHKSLRERKEFKGMRVFQYVRTTDDEPVENRSSFIYKRCPINGGATHPPANF